MPEATMEHEDQWKLPKDSPLPAVLKDVKVKTINWKDKNTGEAKSRDMWEWEFEITDGDLSGLKAWGETEDRLTTHPDNKVRQWGEALQGSPYELGQGISTDDLLGLPCIIIVDNIVRTKPNGENFYGCPVTDVIPDGTDVEPGF